jgi:arabinofuranosyltransferase
LYARVFGKISSPLGRAQYMERKGLLLLSSFWHRAVQILLLALCALAFFAHACEYEYVQDDAYISLVYAQNWVDGHGLVFNAGERVEGYTNFLWTLLLAVPHVFGVDAVNWAQAWGFISIIIAMLCCVAIAERLAGQRSLLWAILTPALLAANGALGFWALCGMETAFFALLLTGGAYVYLRELESGKGGYTTACVFSLVALTRPEGLAFYALTALHRAVCAALRGRFVFREQVYYSLPFAVIVGAHFIFRYLYYGALLPNTFYAKTSWQVAYVEQGLNYAYQFMVGYGLWGGLFLAPLVLVYWQRQQLWFSYVALLVLFNVLYVVVVGGDGWLEHRFFMPLLPLMYIALQEVLYELVRRMSTRWPQPLAPSVAFVLVALLSYHSYAHAIPSLKHSQALFMEHNARVEKVASYINALAPREDFTLATGTIGIVKYRTRARVVDILGLTDAHIARHPVPLAGVESAAGEVLRKYDIAYVLDQRPHLIFFLTGLKPVKAAEKALYLSRRFRQRYYAAYIEDEMPVFVLDEGLKQDSVEDVFARADFVEAYIAGLNAVGKDWPLAATHLLRAVEAAPAGFPYAYQSLGGVLVKLGRPREADRALLSALAVDERCVKALVDLSLAHIKRGEFAAAQPLAQRAVELSAHSQQVRLAAGLSQIFSHPHAALAHLQEAVAMRGANGDEAAFYLGLAYKNTGEKEQALAIWQDLLRRAPDDERLQRAIASL